MRSDDDDGWPVDEADVIFFLLLTHSKVEVNFLPNDDEDSWEVDRP